jgi:acetolactate synthase-1/2/3 large subunit
MSTNIQAVSDALVDHGVDTVFGLIGNGNLELVADLVDRKRLRYLSFRHEAGAVSAADGYSRAADRLGVATVTHGPGFTNAVTALVTAQRARSRLLLIAGNAMGYAHRSTQKLDQVAVARALGVRVVSPKAGDDWAAATDKAMMLAQEQPVLLDLPADAATFPATRSSGVPAVSPAAPFVVDEAGIRQALAWLEGAQRPFILAGRGALRAGVRQELLKLADRLGARLGTTLAAKGLFAGEAGDIGLVGGLGSPLSMAACRECDLVLAVGASLNGFTTEHATLFKSARIIRIDTQADAPSSIAVDLPLIGDASGIVAKLSRPHAASPSPWPVLANDIAPRLPAGSWPGPVFDRLDELLPQERAVVFDHGDRANWAVPRFTAHDPTQSLFMPDFGSLGLSLSAAIGAAAARPDRRTVVIVGDGGLMMSLPELDTLHRAALPVTVIVANDGVYGAEYPHLMALGASLAPATFESSPIAGIARAVGLRSYRIMEGDGLDALAEAIAGQEPTLVEIVCPPPAGGVH